MPAHPPAKAQTSGETLRLFSWTTGAGSSTGGGTETTVPAAQGHRLDGAMPERMGAYRIIRRLAVGGMGIVYEAEHECLGRRAAIKVLRASLVSDSELTKRFVGEAVAATQIRHRGVVGVYDFGYLEDGTAYLAMEYLEGQSLQQRLDDGPPIPLSRVVELGRELARTLAKAHAAGIVHRDIKPDNIFLVANLDNPGHERTKLLDFGVAKFIHEHALATMESGLGEILGTPWYMAPEQCRGSGDVDCRSDVYSLGCVLFQLACGRKPFAGSLVDVLTAHRHTAPPPLRSISKTIPVEFEQLVMRMLAKDPAERPQSMQEVESELAKLDLSKNPVPVPAVAVAPTAELGSVRRFRRGVSTELLRRSRLRPLLLGTAIAVLVLVLLAAARSDGSGHDVPAPEISASATVGAGVR